MIPSLVYKMKPSKYLAFVRKCIDDEVAVTRGHLELYKKPNVEIISGKQLGDEVLYGLEYTQEISVRDGRSSPISLNWGVRRSLSFTCGIYAPKDVDNLLQIGSTDSGVWGYLLYREFVLRTDLEKVISVTYESSSTSTREITLGMGVKYAIPKALKELSIQSRRLARVGREW